MCIFERCAKPDTGTLPAALQRKARGAMCQRAGKRQRICSGHPYLRGAPGTGRVQKNEVRPQLKQPAHGTQHKAGVKIGAQQRGTRFDGQCGQHPHPLRGAPGGIFQKKGQRAVLFGRCIPIIRSLISVPAGMARMEMPKFLLFTIIGSTVWNILLVGTGAAVGVAWEQAAGYVKMYADIVFLVLAAGAVCFPAVHLYRKKHK